MTARPAHRLVARAIFATRAVDRAHRIFDRARARAVERWAPAGVRTELSVLAYQATAAYHPAAASFRSKLFPWEVAALRDYVDPPPGRILLGGAGGGREAFALAERGYEVVAFEPAPELAAEMAQYAGPGSNIRAFRAGYEDLPALRGPRPGDASADLRELGRFSAAVFGWGSYSYLMTRQAQLDALRMLGDVTEGPILVSFLTPPSEGDTAGPPGRRRRHDRFSITVGCYHMATAREFSELAAEAGLTVVALNIDETDFSWPHAILRGEVKGAS